MTLDQPPVMVVTEAPRHRAGALWAAIAAGALVVGGGTFALWSAQDTFEGGTITAGDLNLVLAQDTEFYDVSADRSDVAADVVAGAPDIRGHLITTIDSWRIVPGDKVAAAFSADVTLEGDNLIAELVADGFAVTDDGFEGRAAVEEDLVTDPPVAGVEGVDPTLTWTYAIYQQDEVLVSERALPTADGRLLYLAAPESADDGQLQGAADADGVLVHVMEDIDEDFTIVVFAEFDSKTPDRVDISAEAVLNSITVHLNQVRTVGVGLFVTTPAPDPEP